MRVRRFELRLVAAALVAGWATAAGLVLLTYRPGGPLDVAVGVAMVIPVGIALCGLIWPPVTRGSGAFSVMVWLGIGALLCLIPSALGVLQQLRALGSQTLLPSPEAAYPWVLALIATSLFSGLGIARRLHGAAALRRRRFTDGVVIGLALTIAASGIFAGVAVANELAVRDRDAVGSRFGPTGSRTPPACDALVTAGRSARLAGEVVGTVDQRPIGSIDLSGERMGTAFRWTAYVATDRRLGLAGVARIGDAAWIREPGGSWLVAERIADVIPETLDVQVLRTALAPGSRVTAEDRGVEVLEGARARRCRVAVDGDTFRAAFPLIRWLVGDADLSHWRGQLDYWVFLDGQLGQVTGSVNGEATGIEPDALQATIRVRLTATERDRDRVVYPPA